LLWYNQQFIEFFNCKYELNIENII
jgi:hypothetical protein